MTAAEQAPADKHPIVLAAIDRLVPAADQPLAIKGEDFDEILAGIEAVEEPGELITIAEEFLSVAYSLQTEHASPTAASALADLSSQASRRATQLKKGWGGHLDRVVDVGERYERFRDGHTKYSGRGDEQMPSGPTVKIEALNPLRRV